MADELNVKEVINQEGGEVSIQMDTKLTPDLESEGLARDLTRSIQNARKNAGFNVEDRIKLRLESDSKEVNEAISKFKDLINAETLATTELTGEGKYSETVKLNSHPVTIYLTKA